MPGSAPLPRAPPMGELADWYKLKREKKAKQSTSSIFTPASLRPPPPPPWSPEVDQQGLVPNPQGIWNLRQRKGSSAASSSFKAATNDDGVGSDCDSESAASDRATSMSSKMSRSRPANQRGPKRKKANLQRMIMDKRRYDPNFVYRDRHTVREATSEAAAFAAGINALGAEAKGLHATVIEGVQRANQEDSQEFWKNYTDLPESQDKWVEWRGGDAWCKICCKAGWAHINSGPHLKKLEERCLSNLLAGPSDSQRRFEKKENTACKVV